MARPVNKCEYLQFIIPSVQIFKALSTDGTEELCR